MKEGARLKIKNNETDDISSLIETSLSAYDYPNELKIRYSFIFEEILLKWKKEYSDDEIVDFARYESKSGFRFEISINGSKNNPLDDSNSDDMANSVISILKTGVGPELRYKYYNGRNIVFLTLPKKNVESRILERNMTKIAIPMMAQFIILSIAPTVAGTMLGSYDQVAFSASSLVSQFTLLFNAIISGIGVGTTVVLSRYWMKRDLKTSANLMALTILIEGGLGLIFFAVAEFAPRALMNFYTNIPDLIEEGVVYLRYSGPYYLFYALADVYLIFLRNVKSVTKGSAFVIFAQVINLILSGIMIFGLFGFTSLGIKGAGLSASISGLALVTLTTVEYLRSGLLKIKIEDFTSISKELVKEYFSFSWPVIVNSATYNVALNVIGAIIGHTNADAVAAVAVKNTMYNLLCFMTNGVGTAAILVISCYMTIEKKNLAIRKTKLIFRYMLKLAVVQALMFVLTRLILPFAYGSLSEGAFRYIDILWVASTIGMFLTCLNNGNNCRILQPSGDTLFLFIADTCVMWGVVVLGMFIGSNFLSLPAGVIICMPPLTDVILFPIKHGRCRSLKWTEKLRSGKNIQ